MYLGGVQARGALEIADARVAGEATSFERKNGAEDGIRTRDPLLGKEVLYH
jgi:hypothetical protein